MTSMKMRAVPSNAVSMRASLTGFVWTRQLSSVYA
jgi:hypothetical protein